MIYDKIQDLLILEAKANLLYKGALDYPESARHKNTLIRIMNVELEHFKQVKKILEMISPDIR